jgi:dynein heavy chain
MSASIKRCEKSLNEYLEGKKKAHPRFYFLSNDDLFEILGNSKDPEKINKHIKKCFEGIKKLDFNKTVNTIIQNKGK